jgi:subtilisin
VARTRPRSDPAASSPPPNPVVPVVAARGTLTGRYLVLLREDTFDQWIAALKTVSGLHEVANAADFASGAIDMDQVADADVITFHQIKVAVVKADPTQANALTAAATEDSAIAAVEPEQILYHCSLPHVTDVAAATPIEYLRGYRDAVVHLYDQLTGGSAAAEAGEAAAVVFNDNAQATWGLQATRAIESRFSGRSVAVAVLDTGLDMQHPDFGGRNITTQSFISGQPVQDGHGHGTHTTGTACGSLHPSTRRYGCAYRSNIFVGKVLSNQGSGPDASILAGINWAVTNKCRIVSMSLSAPVQPGEPFAQVYENVGRRALAAGTLIIVAAGNESRVHAFNSP